MHTELLENTDLDYFMEFWGGGFGSAYGFRCVIVSDFFVIGEVLGTGNAVQVAFPLLKSYSRPGATHSYVRRIVKPVVNALVSPAQVLYEPDGVTPRVIPSERGIGRGVPAFRVMLNGAVQGSGYTVNSTQGIVTFAVAPGAGVVVSWSGEFDTPMRFLQNSFQLKPDVASNIQGLQLVEILPSELGIA